MIKTLALIVLHFKKIIAGLTLLFSDIGRVLMHIGDDTLLLPRIMVYLRRVYILVEEYKNIVFIVIAVIIVSAIIWNIFFKKK
jgi:hypothetical protein|tara:strand:- start:208 stop:456 length:249 start_codon:yes stop_codon:yes gene_type:complete